MYVPHVLWGGVPRSGAVRIAVLLSLWQLVLSPAAPDPASAGRRRTVPLPPDPASVASELDATAATNFLDSVSFLYTGTDPVQIGADPSAIDPGRAAVLRGRVLHRFGNPFAGVRVRIAGHPEYGSTRTRRDGMFDLVVNGGGSLVLEYRRAGFAVVRRRVRAPLRDGLVVGDVVLTHFEAPSSVTLAPDVSAPVQVVRSGLEMDEDGTRRGALLFPGGVTLRFEGGGGGAPPDELSVRATELTAGPLGRQAMPAELPPTSAYTYAVDFRLDEAAAAGARAVFDPPLPYYVENFLGFSVGTPVPVGSYDAENDVWVPEESGVVLELVSVEAGSARVDVDGDGAADGGTALEALGIGAPELEALAALYEPGDQLWRFRVSHFSTWDANWNRWPPPDAEPPGVDPDSARALGVDDCDQDCGSIIDIQRQAIRESIPIAGTPYRLHYHSGRVPGYLAARGLEIPLRDGPVPSSLKRIDLQVQVAGRRFEWSFPPAETRYAFTWDGLDAYGRPAPSAREARVRIGYVYDAVYQRVSRFGYNGGGIVTGVPARDELTLWQEFRRPLEVWDVTGRGLGGWELGVQHGYDVASQVLYLGDGSRRSAERAGVIEHVAGTTAGYSGEGGPAASAQLRYPQGLDFAPDGTLYFVDTGSSRVRRIRPDGVIEHAAGSGAGCYPIFCDDYGDGGPATDAVLDVPMDVDVGPDGSLYIAAWREHRVRRVDPSGIIWSLFNAELDGIGNVGGVDLDPTGAVYYATTTNRSTNRRVLRIDPDGRRLRVAGTGADGSTGDGGPAVDASLVPAHVALGPDGSLYVPDGVYSVVRRITPDGRIHTVAGRAGEHGFGGDGGPATEALLDLRSPGGFPMGSSQVAMGPDGTLYIADTDNHRVRRVTPDGIITTVAGTGEPGLSGDGGPAVRARLNEPAGVAVAPDGRALYVADSNNHRIRRIRSPLPDYGVGANLLPSEDGARLYAFDAAGRHLATLDARTGAAQLELEYDEAGRLARVIDGAGLVTEVERDPETGAPEAIVAPFGQRTDLSLGPGGLLASVGNEAGETYTMTYAPGGLLERFETPRGFGSTFQYDALGRLTGDADDAGGFVQLERRTPPDAPPTVVRTTAGGKEVEYAVGETPRQGVERLRLDLATGLVSERVDGPGGVTEIAVADGTRLERRAAPDPRFGMRAPLVSRRLVLPSGLSRSRSHERSVTRDPLTATLVEQVDTVRLNGRAFRTTYTADAREVRTETPEGRVRVDRLDELGRVVEMDPDGPGPLFALRLEYDPEGRLRALARGSAPGAPDERLTTFGHDPVDGRVSEVVSADGASTELAYDAAGRIVALVRPDGEVVDFAYDANGNLTALGPPGKPRHRLQYDEADREVAYEPPPVPGAPDPRSLREYTLDGELARRVLPGGSALDLAYDAGGRLQRVALGTGGVLDLVYDATTGNLSSLAGPGGVELSFTYDGALVTATQWSGPVSGRVSQVHDADFRVAERRVNGAHTVDYRYDADGLRTGAGALEITRHPDHGLVTATAIGGVGTSVEHDGFGQRTSERADFGGSTLYASQHAARDRLGRLLETVETVEGVTRRYEYRYDPAGRLDAVREDGVVVRDYDYDPNGNRVRVTARDGVVTAQYDDQDRLLRYGSLELDYTPGGALASRTDAASGEVTSYRYDLLGNLVRVALPDGRTLEYEVDGLGRRVGKRVDGVLVRGLLYGDALNPVAELDDTGAVVSRFVYGTRAHVPDYMIRAGKTYRILSDRLGSPRLVVDVETGEVAQRLDYDEFGRVTRDTSPGFQPFGFAGGLYDPDTGLVRFGARDYAPGLGRFTAKDPAGFRGGDPNLYAYLGNDPINGIDPSGRFLRNVSNAAAGYGSGASFGATSALNELTGANAVVDECSLAFRMGELAGFTTTATLAGAGAAALAETAALQSVFLRGSLAFSDAMAAAAQAAAREAALAGAAAADAAWAATAFALSDPSFATDAAMGTLDEGPPPPTPGGLFGLAMNRAFSHE